MPRVDSPYLRHPDEYVAFLKGLKADPAHVMVASIVGNPAPVKVILDSLQRPRLEASCTSSAEAATAVPGVRLDAFARAFVERNLSFSICDDMGESLARIGALARQVIDGEGSTPPTPDAGPDSGVSDNGGPACGCDVGGPARGFRKRGQGRARARRARHDVLVALCIPTARDDATQRALIVPEGMPPSKWRDFVSVSAAAAAER